MFQATAPRRRQRRRRQRRRTLITRLREDGSLPPDVAAHLLDQTIRQIRGLHLDHLLPSAMRVALSIATLQASTAEAQVAEAALRDLPNTDPEVPATLVRWRRIQSDVA